MKKTVKTGIALCAAMIVLGLVSCGGDDNKPANTKSKDATLASVKFGAETATLGTPTSTYAGITQAGSVTLLDGSQVQITATPTHNKAKVLMDMVTTGVPDFWEDTVLDFATGSFLALEVTAEDGTTKKYYKIGVTLADVALLVLDEAWLFLKNETFADKIAEWLKVLRKKNVYVVFATQDVADVAKSPLKTTIMQQCLTKIYLADPSAQTPVMRDVYLSFELSDSEISLITNARMKRDYFYTSPAGRRLFQLDLGP
ncbi:MAG: hypothetical protein LBH20_10295 [Treponema sp.]|jgi:hypothetical protein|nr:hypothetical protein [Treponema sp.]